MSDLLTAARAVAASCQEEVDRLRFDERDSIEYAARTKTSIGVHYWQDRYDAELKLRAALALVETLS